MLEKACALFGNSRLKEGIVLTLAQHGPIKERYLFVEHGEISSRIDIVRGDESQPTSVIGNTGSDTSAGLWQPPMLNVAFGELPASCTNQMSARDIGSRQAERHAI